MKIKFFILVVLVVFIGYFSSYNKNDESCSIDKVKIRETNVFLTQHLEKEKQKMVMNILEEKNNSSNNTYYLFKDFYGKTLLTAKKTCNKLADNEEINISNYLK